MLSQSLQQLAKTTMRTADVEGETARKRHPMADIYDLVNRGIAAFHRVVVSAGGGSRYLSSIVIPMDGSSAYALPVDFAFLVSTSLSGGTNGRADYLLPFSDTDRAELSTATCERSAYSLSGDNIEILPAPTRGRELTLWYVPTQQLTNVTDMVDVGLRFDDYITCYAAREIATKDKSWDLVGQMTARLGELVPDIRMYVKRNRGTLPKIADTWTPRHSRGRR